MDRITLATALLAPVLAVSAVTTSLELQVDGMLRIKGGSLEGAQAIIVSDDAEGMMIEGGLAHFVRALQLQTRYLFSFEREGCVTKQILFDTNVPMGYLSDAPFNFPFEVTLERPPTGTTFEYAGPVGFVRFMPELADFGYDTDYSIKRDPMLFERMREFRDKDASLVAAPVRGIIIGSPLAEVSPSHDPSDDDSATTPTPSAVPPLVHPTDEEAMMPVPVREEIPMRIVDKPVRVAVMAVAKSASAVVRIKAMPPAPTQRALSTVSGDSREEQLIVEPRSVTTIVRITHAGSIVELRRVAHLYGAVFYFQGGQSCTERQYAVGVAQPIASR